MSTKRTPIGRPPRTRITPEAVRLFRLCEDISSTGCDEFFEDEGGRRREYLDAAVELHRLLGGKPWQTIPIDADEAEPPDSIRRDPERVEDWCRAWALRCELEKAAGQ